MFIKIFFMIFISLPIIASDFKWSLQITDPTYEVKNISLTEVMYRPYLKKTGWRCNVSKLMSNPHSNFRKLNCDFSVEKAGQVSSVLSCSKNNPYGELILDLLDERKDITFRLMLKCEK